MRTQLKEKKEKLGEVTNYDINLIEVNATQKLYEKYNLPALFIEGDGEFRQGDATDEEVFEAARNVNEVLGEPEINVFYAEGHEWEDREDELIAEELYSFLQDEYWEVYEEELMKVVKANWIEFYRDDIEEFLKENYPEKGGQFGYDYSIFINIETGEIFEKIEASSNWMFANCDENRKLIFHANNYDKTFIDYTDLISENSADTVAENLGVELPESWDEMDYDEQIEWVEENASEGIENYNSIMREEEIDKIIEQIEEEEEN